MEFHLLPIFTFLFLALLASHAALPPDPEDYWKSVLPNTPMPKAIKDILHTEGLEDKSTSVVVGKDAVDLETGMKVAFGYGYVSHKDQLHDNPNVALFFLEENIHKGTKMNLHFIKTRRKSAFLPRPVAESIPFASEKIPEILNKFSVSPNSVEAEAMKKTIQQCEEPGIKGEEQYCATSLEAMVDFSTSKLGKRVEAMSTEVEKETQLQKYSITGVKKMAGQIAIACHKQSYAYAVFYCHKTHTTKAYLISLKGADGIKAEAVAVCHTDTSAWNPKHLAFQVLKVKPGTVPICHFLPEDHIVWVPN